MVTASIAISISGCAVRTVWSGTPAHQSIERLQADFRHQAAAVSRAAWEDVRTSPSKIGSFVSMLLDGRKADDGAVQEAAAPSSPAADYLAQKASSYTTEAQQLSSVVADVERQTAEIDTFIRFTDALADDYRVQLASLDTAPGIAPKTTAEVQCDADRHVLQETVAHLRRQKATYEEAVRTLKNEQPSLDTTRFARAIDVFSGRIDKLVALEKMMAQDAPYSAAMAQTAG